MSIFVCLKSAQRLHVGPEEDVVEVKVVVVERLSVSIVFDV